MKYKVLHGFLGQKGSVLQGESVDLDPADPLTVQLLTNTWLEAPKQEQAKAKTEKEEKK